MKQAFTEDKPLYMQVREKIEDLILTGQLKEGEQAPSTNQLVNFYKINHITVAKRINQLVEEGILYKKRGIGMFVAEGAREKLIERRKKMFIEDYVVQFVQEAKKLGITLEEIIAYIREVERREKE